MNKKNKPIVAIFAFLIVAFLAQGAFAQKHYKDIKYPSLNKINVPEVERIEMDNGMILYLVEDHELPLINLSARIGAGSIYDPEEKIGLAGITGSVMRTGGTKTRSGDQIDEELESIAASVEIGIGSTSGFASMSVLKNDVDKGLAILADILMNPAFPQEKIDLQKVQARSGIARRNDNVNGIAFREFGKLIYGPKNVYARHSEYATVDAITRDDLVAFHKKFFHPNNAMLGIWGDFNAKQMAQKIKSAFKDWKKGDFERPKSPDVQYTFDRSVNFIRKDDVNQSTILLGHLGGRLDNPDYFALQVMNDILSGGFASRLFSRVRSDQGLAYSVFGGYGASYDHPGQFYVGCMTKSESTMEAINSLLREVENMKTEPITADELAKAKESFLNSYVFNFDTKGEVVNRLMTYEYYGYPQNFLEKAKEEIEKVTRADVQRVAQKYLQPDKVRILVVGKDEDFDQPLSVLGKVNEIDITIPVAEEKTPEATAETLAKGKSVLDKAIAACGGAEKFQSIKSFEWKGSNIVSTPQGEMALDTHIFMVLPDRLRANNSMPMGQMSQILNGDKAWVVMPQGTRPLPAQMVESMKAQLWNNLSYLFAHAGSEGLTAQHLGSEAVEGQQCEAVLITPSGGKGLKLFVNAETALPVKMSYQGMNMMGAPVGTEKMLSDFREVWGLKIPFKTIDFQDGKKAAESTTTEIKFNVEIGDELFEVKS